MLEHNDHLEFQLDERIYFESGQEIDEMLAISLDPDILVQSLADHVQIRGLIILRGEYRKSAPTAADEPDLGKILNYVEKVVDEDEEIARFTHRFPVEISVPHDRVVSLDDITVSVDSFDYELPVNNTLRLKAAVHIYGIKREYERNDKKEEALKRERASESERESKQQEKMIRHENVLPLEQRNEERSNNETDVVATNKKEDEIKSFSDATKRKETEEVHVYDDSNDHAGDEDEMSEQKETFQQLSEETISNEQQTEEVQKEIKEEMTEVIDHGEVAETDDYEDVETMQSVKQQDGEIDIQLIEQEVDEEETEELTNMTFLTKLFNTGEETYATMKLYIVQTDDTVESIAKKYDISTLLLMKQNDISSDSLEVGQILSIPVQKRE